MGGGIDREAQEAASVIDIVDASVRGGGARAAFQGGKRFSRAVAFRNRIGIGDLPDFPSRLVVEDLGEAARSVERCDQPAVVVIETADKLIRVAIGGWQKNSPTPGTW